MFQDSFSEGQIYWGRFAAVIAVVTTLAFALSQL